MSRGGPREGKCCRIVRGYHSRIGDLSAAAIAYSVSILLVLMYFDTGFVVEAGSSASFITAGKRKTHVARNPSPTQELMNKLQNMNASKILDYVTKDYNRERPPMKDRPTQVELGIYINSFFSISEQTMDYSISMYFRQQWREPRLAYPPCDRNRTSSIRLPDNSWDKLWVPDTFFRNEKQAKFSKMTVNNRLMRLNSTGMVWYVSRITAKLSCPMRLEKFPLDTQRCPMQFESFSYTMDTMYFSWLPKPVDYNALPLPQFKLIDVLLVDCSKNYTSGAYPCAEIQFIIQRDVGYFVIQVFVPSILVVIISWVSFWINVDASPARVNLGLTTVLTTTTLSVNINETLPRVSYIKAIDVWMITCLIFVFAALLEYAFVNVTSRSGFGISLRAPELFRRPVELPLLSKRKRPEARSTSAHDAGPTNNEDDIGPSLDLCEFPSDGGGSMARRPLPSTPKEDQFAASPSSVGSQLVTLRHCSVPVDAGGGLHMSLEPHASDVTIPMPVSNVPPPANNQPSHRKRRVMNTEECKQRARVIDKFSRKLFPLAFILFNIIYWSVYCLLTGPRFEMPPEGEYIRAPSLEDLPGLNI